MAMKAESFCIMIPPPNVTGSLHMGHAFQQTIMDTMIRLSAHAGQKHPVAGRVLTTPGSARVVVERKIAAEGKTVTTTAAKLSSTKFGNGKRESGGTITVRCAVSAIRRLGA